MSIFERNFSRFPLDMYSGRAQLVPSKRSRPKEKKLPLIDNKIAVRVKKADGLLG
jgi:hypothetical protein